MAKTKHPLFSLDARGSVAKALTFVKRGKTHLVEKIPIPYDQKTTRQKAWRTMFLQCVDLWHLLSAAEKQAWESAARPLHMTGYAWYLSQCLKPNPGIYLPLAGGTMTGEIGMSAQKITELGAPVAPNDAARLADLVGVNNFLALTDTPGAYAGEALKVPRVNAAEDALEFAAVVGGYTEGARVYHDAHQSIPNLTWTWIAFNSEYYDTDTIHDNITNNGRLTCKTAGKYLVILQIKWDASNVGSRLIGINVNDITTIGLVFTAPVNGIATLHHISTVIDLSVDEWVSANCRQDSGGALNIESVAQSSPIFLMQRIG